MLAVLFALKAMGGGDVKLLTALALWIEPTLFLKLVIMMALLGGVLTLVFGAWHVMRRQREKLATLEMERALVIKDVGPEAMSLFDLVSKRRNGVAMAEAKDGICSVCHVRLRPQVFNTVRRNEALMQCDSCQRILYYREQASRSDEEAAGDDTKD